MHPRFWFIVKHIYVLMEFLWRVSYSVSAIERYGYREDV